jgi:hypothetical protein
VTSVVRGFGITRSCVEGMQLLGFGGNGSGFEARVSAVDATGIIEAVEITNHGVGYISPPMLYSNLPTCLCGTVVVDGEALPNSYLDSSVPGNFASCFTTGIAQGARFSVRGGWGARTPRLCARFGHHGSWTPVSVSEPLVLAAATTGDAFAPTAATSGVPLSLTVTGTGFLSGSGPLQTRVKIAFDCGSDPDSDVNGAVLGGEGATCSTLTTVSDAGGAAEGQACVVDLTLTAPASITALQVCRRIGAGPYVRVGSTALGLAGFSLAGISPASAFSNQELAATVSAVHLSRAVLPHLTFKVCPAFACSGGSETDNNQETCGGLADTSTCVGSATCQADAVCGAANESASLGTMVGGSSLFVAELSGCAAGSEAMEYECSGLVLNTTLVAMADVSAVLYWRFTHPNLPGPAVFERLEDADLDIEGSKLTSIQQFGSVDDPVRAAQTFSFWVRGLNILPLGLGAAEPRFKYSSAVFCSSDGGYGDTETIFLGGGGRPLSNFSGTREDASGTLTFTLQHKKVESQRVKLCWRVGQFRYREVASPGVDTVVVGSRVISFSPSDYMTEGLALGDKELPSFASNEVIPVQVMGSNLGETGESRMMIRAVPMPFAMDSTAMRCVLAGTTLLTRPPFCKEFKFYRDQPDGDAHLFCEGGSGIDSVPLLDYAPVNITYETRVFDILEETRAFANFELQVAMLVPEVRAMLCWRMGEHDKWEVVGHLEQRQQDQGVNGIVTWDIFATHTFAFRGAYLHSVGPAESLHANVPATVTLSVVGMPCSAAEPAFRVKFSMANTFQGIVGSAVGGGCQVGAGSDSYGTVLGGEAVSPRCRPDLSSNQLTVVEIDVTLQVEATVPLELCWSSTTGETAFENVFFSGRQRIATLTVLPPVVTRVLVNAQSVGTVPIRVHQQFSVSLEGSGFLREGPVTASVTIAESCSGNPPVPLAGGANRSGDCWFPPAAISAEFIITQPSAAARVCTRGSDTQQMWTRFAAPKPADPATYKFCDPSYCGAPTCQEGTNYLFDGFACDEECCQAKCAADLYCRYWQRFVIPSRVYRKCQTMAHCYDMTIQPDVTERGEPHIYQRTVGVVHVWKQHGPAFQIAGPEILAVTPQQHPAPRAGSFFSVMIQGRGFARVGQEVSVKLADKHALGGACNDEALGESMLTRLDELGVEAETTAAYLKALVNFSFNGTCAGGQSNCVGGPAPAGTVCANDIQCVPGLGGVCKAANTGQTCLHDDICTFGGFCNNSRYNESLLPPPVVPVVEIPFLSLDNAGTVPGGQAIYVDVESDTLARAYFRVAAPADAVVCAALRTPAMEVPWSSGVPGNSVIIDRRLIVAMAAYSPVAEVTVHPPIVTEAFPEHAAPHVATTFRLGGVGLAARDVVKVVYAREGCVEDEGGLRGGVAWQNSVGAVLGGKTREVERVDTLGLRAEVAFTLREPPTGNPAHDEYALCYSPAYHAPADSIPAWRRSFDRVGEVWVLNRPPVVEAFFPREIVFEQLTRLVFNGTGLGAGHRVKLVSAEQPGGCRGLTLAEAVSDAALLLHGTPSALVSANPAAADFVSTAESTDSNAANTANHAFTGQAWASLRPRAPLCAAVRALLCIRYAELGDSEAGGGAAALPVPGYHPLGELHVLPSRARALLTDTVPSGVPAQIEIAGEGLSSVARIELRVIHAEASCSDLPVPNVTDPDSGGVKLDPTFGGGAHLRVLPKLSSPSLLRASIIVPSGLDGRASVCFRVAPCAWAHVPGSLTIHRPANFSAILLAPGAPAAAAPLGIARERSILLARKLHAM